VTDRIVSIRPFTLDDVEAVTAGCQDPEISRWTAMVPFPYTEEHARTWFSTHEDLWQDGEGAEFAVTRETSGEFLGAMGLRPIDWDRRTSTVGYWVAS
jgi:RimJ/RimL family protein N-acetyltransferase